MPARCPQRRSDRRVPRYLLDSEFQYPRPSRCWPGASRHQREGSWLVQAQGIPADGAPVRIVTGSALLPFLSGESQHVVGHSSLENSLRQAIGLPSAGSNGQQVNIGERIPVTMGLGAKQPQMGVGVIHQQIAGLLSRQAD